MEVQAAQALHSVVRTMLRTVMAIFLSGPTAGLFAAALTEGVSYGLTREFPGTLATHLLSLAFFIVVGYSVSLTYAVIESVKGAIRLTELLEHEIFHPQEAIQRRMREVAQPIVRR